MNVQTKIALLLLALAAAFIAGLGVIRLKAQGRLRQIAEERLHEGQESVDRRLEKGGEPLEALAEDYTYWDAMVEAVQRSDQTWLEAHVGEATLDKFTVNAVWVARADGSPLYMVDNLYGDQDLHAIPRPAAAFEKLAREKLGHFYFFLPQHGLMEVRAATIHGSKDYERHGPVGGFFFAGRLWSNEKLDELGLFSDTQRVWIAPPGGPERLQSPRDDENGVTTFTRPLPGWDGQPVARLAVRSETPMIPLLNTTSRQLFWALGGFALVLTVLLTFALVKWVSRPLQHISNSLRRGDLSSIARLEQHQSEFGELARLIRQFFTQRDSLLREIREREATEKVLAKREEELRHAQKMEAVGRLAGGVAHDFNNLLTAIIGYAEILTRRLKNDATGRQNAEMILKAGEQAAGVTRQLLAFSRKQLLQPKVIDLNEVVAGIDRLLRRVIGEHITLVTRPDAAHGRVRADPTQLEQVILNLGVNARDAMPRGGKLTISTANAQLQDEDTRPEATVELPDGDYVVLVVTDTGKGMERETQSHIFEPFFTTKGPGKGTGLGLSTVYGIVTQSGGAVAVDSSPNRGTTFRIYLPCESAPLSPPSSVPAPPRRAHDSEVVLVVEDEEIVRELVCSVLHEQGYRVHCAAHGGEALEMAARAEVCASGIDLLITDVVMPHMSGPELVKKITANHPEARVLFVSGYSENDISDRGVLADDIRFLEKPFTPLTLARKVREVLDEPPPSTTTAAEAARSRSSRSSDDERATGGASDVAVAAVAPSRDTVAAAAAATGADGAR
ncbi:MAG: response regulator [Verrucomicrobia bacterium]|nr:response regulator [Verrucomicrobiota bacterium]